MTQHLIASSKDVGDDDSGTESRAMSARRKELLERLESFDLLPTAELLKIATSKPHPITETFYSVQGEGARAGRPAYFIRYNKCNFRCSWCDSQRTWLNKRTQTVESMMEELSQTAAKTVIITGGEPMLYRYDEAFVAFVAYLKRLGMFIEVESDAALPAPPVLMRLVDQWNLSPKIGSSGVEMTDRYAEAIQTWVQRQKEGSNIWYKFVVRDTQDMQAVLQFVGRFEITDGDRIFLMPEGNSIAEQMDHMSYVAERCLVHGFSFAPRTHVLIWGGEEAR